jgi:hypothetical protein
MDRSGLIPLTTWAAQLSPTGVPGDAVRAARVLPNTWATGGFAGHPD